MRIAHVDDTVFIFRASEHRHLRFAGDGWRLKRSDIDASKALADLAAHLGGAAWSTLRSKLAYSGFLLEGAPTPGSSHDEEDGIAGHVSLASALTDESGIGSGELVVHAHNEVLLLPANALTRARRQALRLFIGGMTGVPRRRCYAALVSGRDAMITNDAATPSVRRSATALLEQCSQPTCLSRIAADAPPVISILGSAPGRLHPCQKLRSGKIVLRGGTVLHTAESSVAAPNLRLADRYLGLAGWGIDERQDVAQAKATSEAVERYALGSVPAEMLVACASELHENWLDPRLVVEYTPTQLERQPLLRAFREDEPRTWVPGLDARDERIMVLADLVFNPFVATAQADRRLHTVASSSGVAAAHTTADARERALLEILERDAFMRAWLGRLACPRIAIASLPTPARKLTGWCGDRGVSVSFVQLPSQTVSAILAYCESPDGLVVGLAAGSPSDACIKSIREAVLVLHTGLPAPITDPALIRSAADHAAFYWRPGMADRARFLLGGDEIALGDLPSPTVSEARASAIFVALPTIEGQSRKVVRCHAPALCR